MEFFGGAGKIEESVENWILYKTELKKGTESIKDIVLE